ncbi:MAG: hypothetical protein EAZ42_03505 [Verrucomicrobia bacterium]|nr:MAG: hypothetical protein EAZ42_03505 [Verrucomicrobiota bacterium]
MDLKILQSWAEEEVAAVTKVLPEEMQTDVKNAVILYADKASEEEIYADSYDDPPVWVDDSVTPPVIQFFLNTIWMMSGEDEQDFRDEVGMIALDEWSLLFDWDGNELTE